MGTYLNPGNGAFARAVKTRYIDKTGLIGVINGTIDTARNLTCVSRPRRFGKSYAAQMLCAYYDRTVDSRELFAPWKISTQQDYETHLNRYDVIYLDMTNIKGKTKPESFVSFLVDAVTRELLVAYPDIRVGNAFDETLVSVVERTGRRFIVIIDEWDVPIREFSDEVGTEYLLFLRMLFKSSATTAKLFSAVYMTGILPIKKLRTQSALSDFREYSMLRPGPFAEYVGFTEDEVRGLCREYGVDFSDMKRWYDGYELKGVGSVYNPNSVMSAIESGEFDSYWSRSSAADNLLDFIRWDVDGLRQAIIALMGGVSLEIDTLYYDNDLTYDTRDAALTMFVHLGYLTYNQTEHTVRIPNEEIRLEFTRALRKTNNGETLARVRESDKLILDTIHGKAEAVAAQVGRVHEEVSNPLNRNSEASLRAAIQVAYFAYKDYYLKLEELPTGKGYADIVYIPKPGKGVPALLVELKWNEGADTAIRQIKEKGYADGLKDFGTELLLVGIGYDRDGKAYRCRIDRWEKPD